MTGAPLPSVAQMLNEARGIVVSTEVRRLSLRRLDALLDELELLNLADAPAVPDRLARQLHAVGVGFHRDATVTSVIDQLFKTQERFLTPIDTRARRRNAA